MTVRDKSTLEYTERFCEDCCNFDKEHIGMDCTALCKLTMTLAYAEDYGGNCMFYNVPKELIIVPPCKVGDTVYVLNVPRYGKAHSINRATVVGFHLGDFGKICGHTRKEYLCVVYDTFPNITHIPLDRIGKTVFLTKEEAERALKERADNEV